MRLSRLLSEKEIIVCCGAGGVGKTTVSAALAVSAAVAGRKVLVCTIDPAKRLADSLGLTALGNSEARIPDEAFERAGLKPKGELWGMMLDSKTTFDELMLRIAPTPEAGARILANPFYQNITTALAGSQEFSATEKLFELAHRKQYDLIVLDTPPTKHALDFLDAPNRLTAFLDAKVIQWFVKPYLSAGKAGFKFINASAQMMFRLLERATGHQTMSDIADFFLVFDGLTDGFRVRAAKVRALMSAPSTAFVLVTSPQSPSLLEARYFLERLVAENMPLGEVVFNRVYLSPTDLTPEAVASAGREAEAALPAHASAIRALTANLRLFMVLAEADKRSIRRFLAEAGGGVGDVRIPFLESDVHDLAGLYKISQYIE